MSAKPAAEPLRVLHVIGGLELGGAETLLYRLVTHPSPGLVHEVVCLGSPDWYSAPLEGSGVQVHHLGMTSVASGPRGAASLRKIIQSSGADVIHSWMYFANVLSGLLGKRANVPVVWGIHATSVARSGLASRFCAYAGGAVSPWLASVVVNCSHRSAEAHRRLGYSAVQQTVIPNGYDPAAFYPDEGTRASVRASLGLPHDSFLIGVISRWHPDKDIPTLLQAISLARRRGVEASCLLIGRGLDSSNAELRRRVDQAGLSDCVLALGLRHDVDEILRTLDLHVLPSRSEAFPTVIAESMLSAVPNVATDVGDSAEMMGDTGWVVAPADPVAMSAAIEGAYRESRDSPDEWQGRRAAARERILERFTFDRMAEAYERLWRQVANTR